MGRLEEAVNPGGKYSPVSFLFLFAFRRPKLSLAIAAIIALMSATGIRDLRTEPALESLTNADLPAVRFHREVRANFEDSSNMFVVARGSDLFSEQSVALLKKFEQQLSSAPGVEFVRSIFNVPVLVELDHGNIVEPLLGSSALDKKFLEYAKVKALDSPILRNNFVNGNGTAIFFSVSISNPEVYPEKARKAASEITALVERANSRNAPLLKFYELGLSTGNAELLELFKQDTVVLVPLAFLVVGCTIFFFYRSWLAVFLPLLTGTFSIVATLGLMGHVGIPINILLYTIILLILVLGCTEDLHLLSEYGDSVEARLSDEKIFHRLGNFTGRALFLTSLTTCLGFLSIAFTPLGSLREFALCLAAAMAFNFVFTALVVPALFRITPRPKSFSDGRWNRLTKRFREDFLPISLAHAKSVKILFGIAGLVFLFGSFKLSVDTDLLKFFPFDSRTRSNQRQFSRDFGGAANFTVIVETGRENGVFADGFENSLEDFQDSLEDTFDGVLGYMDARNEFASVREELKDSSFAGVSAPGAFMRPNFVDFDASRAAFYVRTQNRSSRDLLDAGKKVQQLASRILPEHCTVAITGERVVLAKLTDSVSSQLLVNLGILAVITALTISIFLRSPVLGLVSIIPNVFPVVATFGIMGLFGVPFSIGTFPVVIIAFALAVDDTIHIATRFSLRAMSCSNSGAASLDALRREAHPVLATSITLCLGYLVLTVSKIPLHREISLLFTFAVLMALLADLLLTPALLSSIRQKDRQKSHNPVLTNTE